MAPSTVGRSNLQAVKPHHMLYFSFLVPVFVSWLCLRNPSVVHTAAWSVAQWLPRERMKTEPLQTRAWEHWEYQHFTHHKDNSSYESRAIEIPTVDIQQHRHHLRHYLDTNYGKDWRQRPLLLRGLWTANELQSPNRRLSLSGLLKQNLTIPYFTDARKKDALTPDGYGTIQDILRNLTETTTSSVSSSPQHHHHFHKIASQLIVQTFPELIQEIAPVDIVTTLFGNYFTPEQVRGSVAKKQSWWPALTTVPVFVARTSGRSTTVEQTHTTGTGKKQQQKQQSFTALHCEPIGNVAVQLAGQKQWTLIGPQFSTLVRPALSPDGRAFFASFWSDPSYQHVPSYSVVTAAGDAVYVPPWTWHRVDYHHSGDNENDRDEIAIGGSLFHFRPIDFVRNNPLFAFLVIPSILRELVGWNTQ